MLTAATPALCDAAAVAYQVAWCNAFPYSCLHVPEMASLGQGVFTCLLVVRCILKCAAGKRILSSLYCTTSTAINGYVVQKTHTFLQDDDVLHSLSRRSPATGLKARALYWYRQLVDRDIVAVIRRDPALLQIHNRGEEFDKPAEDCFAQMQVSLLFRQSASMHDTVA